MPLFYASLGASQKHALKIDETEIEWNNKGLLLVEAKDHSTAASAVTKLFGLRWAILYREEEMMTFEHFPLEVVAKLKSGKFEIPNTWYVYQNKETKNFLGAPGEGNCSCWIDSHLSSEPKGLEEMIAADFTPEFIQNYQIVKRYK